MRVSESDRPEGVGGELRRAAWCIAAGILILVAPLPGCRASNVKGGVMNLTSTSFQGSQIPAKFTCNGAGISPQLGWSAPPAGTVSLALIVTDPDAPGRTFVHWVIYDLPAETRALPEGLPGLGQLADGSRQGRNDFDEIGYGGPCPPGNSAHHYHFTLYALDAKLSLPVGETRAQLEAAMRGHVLARGELIGLYQR
ncbi:MAG: YbhB/YbcL family Raf kinase inhibitor-like protein [Terracidiphilus sp.]|jgi:Raf kinase inhibitor-like YbhB/YbcL family protein